ncbi:hypothetical protein [Enhygromyxa salina]|uniref:hypothetical protein n=1 Tax=Enhygromyxa salina TaxID=215803 RepID=UPI000D03B960|nr:hypothetical protein [Enhygromyxa salina]
MLERDPATAKDAPLLEALPWGGKPVTAPAPRPPAGIDGMWPQGPICHADFYPSVLHLDPRERDDHLRYTALRYLGQIVSASPRAAWRARVRPRVRALDDAKFCELLTQTSLAQHLCSTLSEADRDAFASTMQGELADYAKIDFSGMRPDLALPGIELMPTVTLFHRQRDHRHRVVAIRLRDAVFTPRDGAAWALARYFVLQGAHVQHTVIVHPRLHFPSDVINAVSKSALPAGHLLARMLLPHTRFSLGLDLAVTHHRRSVLFNSQREVYTALPLTTEGICAAVTLGRVGMPGNHAYPTYDYWGVTHDERTRFGRYCQQWQDAFEDFTRGVCAQIPKGDPTVARWADAISEWVPGFPGGATIFRGDLLAQAIARYLTAVTVLHSGDHYSYAAIPIEYLPMRIRVPPPDEVRPASLDLDKLVSAEDHFRHQLCHRMFFAPTVIESLNEVRYRFRTPAARQAAQRFQTAQHQLDARWAGSGFPASYEIASSIQY